MLARTEFEMSEAIRDFSVATLDGELLGCGALHFYSPTIAEIRSLAVHEHAKTHGVGRKLVEALVDEAEQYELHAVFAFTYVDEFFNKVGFDVVERGALPLKAWKDCSGVQNFNNAMKSPCCAFFAPMIGPMRNPNPGGRADDYPHDELIQIPTPRK